MDRRGFLLAAPALLAAQDAAAPFATVEQRVGGRLGVYALDMGTRRRLGHRADERFAMCSTFKALLAARILHAFDEGRRRPDERLTYGHAGLLPTSPVSEQHMATGLTLVQACEAAVTQSDNTAANLLLSEIGGPAGLTRWLRSVGDPTTRLDRTELRLNSALPGDPRDTTTPAAIVATWRELLLGAALRPSSRVTLEGWLRDCATGAHRLRAGLPSSWRSGDKTGTSGAAAGTWNDIAITRPPGRAPILISAFLTRSPASAQNAEGALAEVARIVAEAFAHG